MGWWECARCSSLWLAGVSTSSSFETIAREGSAVRTACMRSLRMRAIELLCLAAGVVSLDWVSVFALGRSAGVVRVTFTRVRRQIIWSVEATLSTSIAKTRSVAVSQC